MLALLVVVGLTACAPPAQTFSSVQGAPPPQEEIAELRERFPAPPFDFPTAPPSEGSGTSDDPWQLSTPEQLAWMADPDHPDRLAGYYILVNDITAPDSLVIALPVDVMIDREARAPYGFQGNFYGNGYTITVNIYLPYRNFVGLFGHIGVNGRVQNLNVVGSVEGGQAVGGLAGMNDGEVTDSSASVVLTGERMLGGLIGGSTGDIIDSSATGNVSGTRTGGLVGENSGTVQGSYATGNVNSRGSAGGLVGRNWGGM